MKTHLLTIATIVALIITAFVIGRYKDFFIWVLVVGIAICFYMLIHMLIKESLKND